MSYRDSRGVRGGDYRDKERDRSRGDRDRNFGGGRYDRNDGGGRGGGGRNRNFGDRRYKKTSLFFSLPVKIFRFDDRNNQMVNSGPPPPFPAAARERKSRWDPIPRHGIIEKNFYVLHPDVTQRQEVYDRFFIPVI